MRPEYEIFNHTNANTISDRDAIEFLMDNSTIEYFHLNVFDKKDGQPLTKLKGYKLLAIICCGNEFALGDFDGVVSEITDELDDSDQITIGWKVDDSITKREWNAHILIGINEEQVTGGVV